MATIPTSIFSTSLSEDRAGPTSQFARNASAKAQAIGRLPKLRQHLLRDELVARVVEMVAVVGEEAFVLVIRVVFLPVADEGLAEIVEGHLPVLGHVAGHLGEGFQ